MGELNEYEALNILQAREWARPILVGSRQPGSYQLARWVSIDSLTGGRLMDPHRPSRPHQSQRHPEIECVGAGPTLAIPFANYRSRDQQPMTANGGDDPYPIPWLDRNGSLNRRLGLGNTTFA